jgi:hypothetical protein
MFPVNFNYEKLLADFCIEYFLRSRILPVGSETN